MRKLWLILVGILSVTGLLTILTLAGIVYGVAHMATPGKPDLPKQIVLEIDLNQGVVDEPPVYDPLHAFTKQHGPLKLAEIDEALELAGRDQRVKGLSLRLGSSELGLAQAQEVRAALLKFKATGKPIFAFAESFGEMGGGTIDAYVASAAVEIWMQPSGDMGLIGFSAEMPFIKGSLDLLGIRPEFQRRHEFKSAIETFTEKSMTAESRESMKSLLDSFLAQVVAGLAEGRRLPVETVRALIDQGPLGAEEALEAKLIDRLGYADEADDAITDKFPESDFVDLAEFLSASERLHAKGAKKIAVIHAQGPVVGGAGGQPFDGSKMMVAGEIAEALADAGDDEDVAAIILRIDSPGGSYLASDTIWRAVALAKEAGKPVIASIGDMAASGGYFVAMGADRILAQPGAITGSIGVFAGKMVITDFLTKLGVGFEEIDAGANAGLLSPNRPFTPGQRAKLSRMLDRIYADFTAKAGQGRKLDMAAMDKVARGRVFTGEQALKAGLIDELGGFDAALAAARKAAKLDADAKIQLVYQPKPLSPVEKMLSLLESGGLPFGLQSLARLAWKLDAMAERMGLIEAAGHQARMPPVKVRN
ncbi:MAG: signal peptide peptidase SppA [Rhodospirillales bacterium]|nr:signal peptide peptidase SppA [Rhodospirillales bacterium]